LVGVEVGGAVKNVMAIAAGVADGLHCGHNARAALLTRGLAEISRLAQALGGQAATLMGLSGLGDLILTCTGNLSRNRRVGMLLAEGRSLDDVLASLGHVAEGVPTARETLARARALGVDMPITAGVCAMLFGQASPQQVVDTLLERAPKAEDGSELG
jgi:glycerol-3-phosphate dehydrogenase (NAD(P)+)